MTNLKPAVLEALSALPACAAESFAREELFLPILVVSEESGSVLSQADGCPYLEECLLQLDVYAATRQEADSLAAQADEALTALGLRRIQQQDLYDQEAYAFQKSLRYRAVIHGDTLYQ